jgi:cytochrome c biogenesis protein CcmG, thiol:disulfide interchange protein DsbE
MDKLNLWRLIFLAILVLGSGWLWWSRAPEDARAMERAPQPALNHPAPPFTLTALDGATFALNELHGQPLVINFWATWCFPCRQEMPMLQSTWERYGDSVLILGVDVGEQETIVQDFVDEFQLTFPILLDEPMAVAGEYNVRGLPTTFFIDGNGIIRQIYPGELNSAILAEGIQKILR